MGSFCKAIERESDCVVRDGSWPLFLFSFISVVMNWEIMKGGKVEKWKVNLGGVEMISVKDNHFP